MERTKDVFEGSFFRPIYANVNGTSIALYRGSDGNMYTVTGNMLPTTKNLKYLFKGEWINNPKYGRQFRADYHEMIVNNDEDSIIAYLSSGIIKGIGKVTAKKIVARFGTKTLEVMDRDLEQLSVISGISPKKMEKIRTSYENNRQAQDVIIKLGKCGISPKIAAKAYEIEGNQIGNIIENKPYLLCMVPGITFPVADKIGRRDETYEKDYDRFKVCAKYVLLNNENNKFVEFIGNRTAGSLGMDKNDFGNVMLSLLKIKTIDGKYICDNTLRMIREGEIVYKKIDNQGYLFLAGINRIEESIAKDIFRLSREGKGNYAISHIIKEAELELGITLNKEQYDAVFNAINNGVSLLIGPPGTGKTTTIQVIAYVYKRIFNERMVFIAPSGKAATRIQETSGYFAQTAHSMFKIGTEIYNDVDEDIEVIVEDSLLVIDEMSMLDARTAYRVFAAIGNGNHVVLCGDDAQLPSVGAGAVLRDLIDAAVLPITELKIIYRQNEKCNIYSNTMKMRRGDTSLVYEGDFHFDEESDLSVAEEKIIRTYIEQIDRYGRKNVMLIVPFREHETGVTPLNEKIQAIVNPGSSNRKEIKYGGVLFRIGDPVMNLKNDTESGVMNGEVGIVQDIIFDGEEKVMEVLFDKQIKNYNSTNMDEVTLAYAYTVHKAQGSEAACVITVCHELHSVMLKRNNVYTAATRAKKEVFVIGQKKAFEKAIRTEDRSKRITNLKMELKKMFGEFITL